MTEPEVATKMWLIIPAAGVGSRMQADRSKQYLLLNGRPIIEHTLERLAIALPYAEFVICLNPEDPYWPSVQRPEGITLREVSGGKERADSVLNGLKMIASQASEDDWVLVHDVARPCVRPSDITDLVMGLNDSDIGGILALPVADTMKRSHPDGSISETVDRTALWHALTPQMFRFGRLYQALEEGLAAGATITDEASALEWLGFCPQLIAGHRDNIKVTHPDDLAFAELFIRAQQEQSEADKTGSAL
ncbi:2-C-methyl-D-erythritol 4-phosphate cytidylyltransferase [Oceanospirillum linum]|uniref:2-C-methyl-D-erythritol 4-phosphate cytidylyltransferase n=1 Tax=Oceanospirillum linum TaxID=966 RepID=UPI00089EED59|nr:2-C-methyl-D-erythritol 4-phosphate cytidylyltransferase [Oceanospirillum linum]SEG04999.1 2-C-methyl-D-erythritol 4-phosphate cytidylyltransferase [Oleiphilus messinensis]SMP20882.1 2-C-methyl-D-erythritol 4-phosphate cytidylyltransferase [Oceanospirillum linum]